MRTRPADRRAICRCSGRSSELRRCRTRMCSGRKPCSAGGSRDGPPCVSRGKPARPERPEDFRPGRAHRAVIRQQPYPRPSAFAAACARSPCTVSSSSVDPGTKKFQPRDRRRTVAGAARDALAEAAEGEQCEGVIQNLAHHRVEIVARQLPPVRVGDDFKPAWRAARQDAVPPLPCRHEIRATTASVRPRLRPGEGLQVRHHRSAGRHRRHPAHHAARTDSFRFPESLPGGTASGSGQTRQAVPVASSRSRRPAICAASPCRLERAELVEIVRQPRQERL